MRRILLLLIILAPITLISQQKNAIYTITGKILDAATHAPIEYATVIFKIKNTNEIAFGCITNSKGVFSIDVEAGNYDATVEYVSYKTLKLNKTDFSQNINLGELLLESDIESLNEIEVVAEKKAVELRLNKQVFNVGKDVASQNLTATEILSNLPSVSVDPNGGIKLRGMDNVQVMINGKTSSLSKADALKSLPAETIEKIEVLANPGAKYSASSLGIINIILKRGKDNGLNASITANGGYKDYYGGLLVVNHKSKNVNFFTNTSYLHRNPITLVSYENDYLSNEIPTQFLKENTENKRDANVFMSTVGIDFYLSSKSTLTPSVNYTKIDANNFSNTFTKFYDASHVLFSDNSRINHGGFNDEITEYVLDFEQSFQKEGQKLSAYVKYSKDKENYKHDYSNTNTNFIDEKYSEINTLKNTEIGVVFANPLSETSEYEFGYLGQIGETPFTFSNETENKLIDYKDNIHAVYLDYGKQVGKLYYSMGLRAEFSNYNIDYNYLNTQQTKNFNDLFPSVYFQYSLTDYQNISLSYSRKIIRPGYYELQPFEQKLSETIGYKGNENLDPCYVNGVQFSYLNYGQKITFQGTLFYNSYEDYIDYLSVSTGETIEGVDKILTTVENIGKLDHYGISTTTIYNPAKWLNFRASIDFYNFDRIGTYDYINTQNQLHSYDFNHSNWEGSFGLLTQIKIPGVFDFQTNIKHLTKSEAAYSVRKAYTYASASLNKDLWNNNASIGISANDIFNSNQTKRDRFNPAFTSRSIQKNKFTTVMFSFTYRFNQKKQDRKLDFEKKEVKPKF